MKVQYIFLRKKNTTIDTKDSNRCFQGMFKVIFDNVTFDTFQITIDNTPQVISFKSSAAEDGVMYLTLSFDGKPTHSAKVLSKVDECLTHGKHRKEFYIINSFDEPSAYYCEKLAPRLGRFERLMRSFIYTSLTKSLGIDWFENSFTQEIKTAIKSKGDISDTDLIERGLHEMTFSQLYDYLFKEFSYCSADSVIYEQLLNQNLYEMDKNSIISIIYSCKKESLWRRFFGDATFDLEEPLRNIRNYRNKVAHNKFIKYAEYRDCTRKLHKINTTLENAIDQLNSDIYTEKHLFDTVMSFAALFAGLLKNGFDMVSQIQKNFSAIGNALIKSLEPYASVRNMTTMYNFGALLSGLQKLRAALTEGKPFDGLPDYYSDSEEIDPTSELIEDDTSNCSNDLSDN